MRNILIVCNTVLQVIFAVNLKYTEFAEDNVDLYISDHMNGGDRIAANSEHFIHRLYEYIVKYNNKNLQYRMYEDGLSSYCVAGEILNKQIRTKVSILHKLLGLLIGKKYAYKNMDAMYFFMPGLVNWNVPAPILEMKKIDPKNKQLINTLNIIFDYESMTDRYDQEFIFFEESYSVEQETVNDLKLVGELADLVGKDNIFVKTHPRNPENRFKGLGYKTNRNMTIPWELIMLNKKDMEKKTLLSIASGSIANPYMIMGINVRAISLIYCCEGEFGTNGDIYNEFLINHIYKPNPNIFFLPQRIEELKGIVDTKTKL